MKIHLLTILLSGCFLSTLYILPSVPPPPSTAMTIYPAELTVYPVELATAPPQN